MYEALSRPVTQPLTRDDPMLMAPHTLALITTQRCTAACEHCCFDCSPQREAALAVADMHRFIDEAKALPSIRLVVFTGGECFLLGRDLDELVRHASGNGYATRFVSNGYWATTRHGARRRLQRLKDCGLTEANFSSGEQHARFVPVASVRHGAMAAVEVGLPSLVTVDAFGESTFDFDGFMNDGEFQKAVDAGQVVLKVSPWMKFNGGRPIAYTENYMDQMQRQRSLGSGCPTLLKVVAITPTYKLCVCCGLTMDSMPELALGSLRNGATIPDLVRGATDDFMKIWIHLHGPEAVLRYAQKLDGSIPTPPDQAHTCDVCRSIYHDPRIRDLVLANPPPNLRAIVGEYVQSLMMPPSQMDSELSAELVRGGDDVEKLKARHRQMVFASPVNNPEGYAL